MKKIGKMTGIFLTALVLLLFTGCGSEEEEIPMGRYNEREVEAQTGNFSYMHPVSDGSYYLYGNNVKLTKVETDGTVTKEDWPWEENSNINVKYSYGIDDDGAVFFRYSPSFSSDEEYEEYMKDYHDLYYYVDSKGEGHPLDLYGNDWTVSDNLENFAFAPDHRLYAASISRVYRVDVESGEVVSLFDTEGAVNEFAFVGDVMVALDSNRAYLYDMAGEKLLDDNEVLSEFVASHQSGKKAIVLTTAQEPSTSDESGTEDILYLGCRTGLYRYVWNGSVIEQIGDGQLLSLGDSQYSPQNLQALPDGEFRLYMSGNHMVELFYDETVPSRPSKELAIYSLEENGRIRYAGRLFQKTHPDVLVKYETGIDGDSAVSREDALRSLSTRLLAGEGPDILILDGMDIGQYADKGMLRSLDDFIAPYEEEESLYQGIIDGMRMGEKDELYAIPLNVYLPMYKTMPGYLEGEGSLEDIVVGAELAREEHPDGPLLFASAPDYLLRQLTIACEPAWTKEDGSLDTDKIVEYYEAASRLWELDNMGLTQEQRTKWQEDVANVNGNVDGVLDELDALSIMEGQYSDFYGIGETWMVLGNLKGPYGETQSIHTTIRNYKEYDTKAVSYGKYIGQAADTYWALSIVGICEDTKDAELSEEFLALCLSEEIQNKWWLGPGTRSQSGIPVRKESFAACMDNNNHEFAEVAGWDAAAISFAYDEVMFPTQEEKEWFYQMMEEASVAYLPHLTLEETVEEVGLSVLGGDMTPQEGAQEVERRMAIAMEE